MGSAEVFFLILPNKLWLPKGSKEKMIMDHLFIIYFHFYFFLSSKKKIIILFNMENKLNKKEVNMHTL